jgi:hypothetical protein
LVFPLFLGRLWPYDSLKLTAHHLSGNLFPVIRCTCFFQFSLYLPTVSSKLSSYSLFFVSL